MFNLSSIETEQPWGLNSSPNPNVDFCVWVLQVDGLRVTPFNHHPAGTQILQQVGFNAQTWSTWLTKVIATQDNRLNWHVPDILAETERQFSNSLFSKFDSQRTRSQLEQYLHWQEQQYQQAAVFAGSFSVETSPAEVCEGNSSVQERLERLWQEYDSISKDLDRIEDLDVISGFYQDLRRQFHSRLPTLRVHLVDYPKPVFLAVPPVSVVLSQVKALSPNDLRTGLFQAIESLAV